MKLPVPSRRANIVLAWVLALALIVFGAWLIGKVVTLGEENHHLEEQDRQSRADRAQLREDVEADRLKLEALAEQLRQLGEQPVVEPEGIPDDTGVVIVPGPKGDRGESCIEEIGYPRCRGAAGREDQEPERQEAEIQNGESDDPEQQDAEIQDPEKDDPDPDDPEKDDPDPASPYNFTFQFVVPGTGGSPDQTYTVTCNSGTGNCSVS